MLTVYTRGGFKMAETDPFELQNLRIALKAKIYDVRFMIAATLFVVGWLALASNVQTNLPLIGPFFEGLRNLLQFTGPIFRIFIIVLLGAFIYEAVITFVIGGFATMKLAAIVRGIVTTTLITYMIVMLIRLMPVLLPALFKPDIPVLSILSP